MAQQNIQQKNIQYDMGQENNEQQILEEQKDPTLKFIEAVKEHKCIWDMQSEEYYNRRMYRAAWRSLLSPLEDPPPQQLLNSKQKTEIKRKVAELQKDWVELRDSYYKNEDPGKKYKDNLKFLHSVYQSREMEAVLEFDQPSWDLMDLRTWTVKKSHVPRRERITDPAPEYELTRVRKRKFNIDGPLNPRKLKSLDKAKIAEKEKKSNNEHPNGKEKATNQENASRPNNVSDTKLACNQEKVTDTENATSTENEETFKEYLTEKINTTDIENATGKENATDTENTTDKENATDKKHISNREKSTDKKYVCSKETAPDEVNPNDNENVIDRENIPNKENLLDKDNVPVIKHETDKFSKENADNKGPTAENINKPNENQLSILEKAMRLYELENPGIWSSDEEDPDKASRTYVENTSQTDETEEFPNMPINLEWWLDMESD